jgi:uncharacterized membrane protein YoaK (UPF0700 family)
VLTPAFGRTPAPRPVVLALVVLTFTTGLVDAVSYLGLGHVFTANMTGNVVLLGFGVAGVEGLPVLAPLVSFGAFFLGAAVAGVALRRTGAQPGPGLLGGALMTEGLVVAIACVVCASTDVDGGTVIAGVVIALLAFAMGVRNAVVRKVGVPDLTTTVLTMTVTGLAADGPTAAASAHGRRVMSLFAMLLGALAGALFVKSALWPPLAITAAAAVALAWSMRATSVR